MKRRWGWWLGFAAPAVVLVGGGLYLVTAPDAATTCAHVRELLAQEGGASGAALLPMSVCQPMLGAPRSLRDRFRLARSRRCLSASADIRDLQRCLFDRVLIDPSLYRMP